MNRTITKLETITALICIVFLILTLGAGLNRGREYNRRQVCAAYLITNTQAILNFAQNNEGYTPLLSSGNWLWDVDYYTTNRIIENGGHRDAFYCPSQKSRSSKDPRFWQYSQIAGTYSDPGVIPPAVSEPTAISDQKGYFRVISYEILVQGNYSRSNPQGKQLITNINSVSNPSVSELIIDSTISAPNSVDGNFSDIRSGGSWYWYQIPDSTNHLTNQLPAGGNMAFVDGHVTWRPFSQMAMRSYIGVYFWW